MLDKHKVFEPAVSPDPHETTSKYGEVDRSDFTTETAIPQSTESSIRKKKKSKKKNKLKGALSIDNTDEGSSSAVAAATGSGTGADSELSGNTTSRILENSHASATQAQGMGNAKAEDIPKKIKLEDILTGLAPGGRYQKDIACYKFWSAQPVAKFGMKYIPGVYFTSNKVTIHDNELTGSTKIRRGRSSKARKIWNAIYTAGIVLPKPISTCRYYHHSLDWLELYEVGFNLLPLNSTKARQVTKYHLQVRINVRGLREMEPEDLDAVHGLLSRYLEKFDMAPKFDKEEVEHWLLRKESSLGGKAVFTHVVEVGGTVCALQS